MGAGSRGGLTAAVCHASPAGGGRTVLGDKALRRLHSLLGRLAPEQRRHILTCSFSQVQRLCLEQWILNARKMAQPAVRQPEDRRCASAQKPRAAGPAVGKSHGGLRRVADIPGVVRSRQMNGTYYWSEVAVGSALRLRSRADRDLSLIKHCNRALHRVRDEVLHREVGSLKPDSDLQFKERFREAILKVPAEVGVRFLVSVKPLWSVRPLYTTTYSVAELEQGLRAWQRLRGARSHKRQSHVLWWRPPADLAKDRQDLREAYLDAMMLAEADPRCDRLSAKLDALEADQLRRQERQMEAWNRSQMAREERGQRRAERRQRRERLAAAARERQQRSTLRLIASILRRWRPEPAQRGKRKRAGDGEGPVPARRAKQSPAIAVL